MCSWALLTGFSRNSLSYEIDISGFKTFSHIRGVELWINSWEGPRLQLANTLEKTLPRITAHPFFREHLPPKVGILLSDHLRSSTGRSSPDLVDPAGNPAVLLRPQDLLASPQAAFIHVAHELTHLVHYKVRPNEENWIREGLALLMEYLVTGEEDPVQHRRVGGQFNRLIRLASDADGLSMTAGIDPENPNPVQYGLILTYFYFMYRNCGTDSLVEQWLVTESPETGIRFLDSVLNKRRSSKNKACESFEDSFRKFSVARYKHNIVSDDEYVLETGSRVLPHELPRADLPPHSSWAYRLGSAQCSFSLGPSQKGAPKHCLAADVPVGECVCVQVRGE